MPTKTLFPLAEHFAVNGSPSKGASEPLDCDGVTALMLDLTITANSEETPSVDVNGRPIFRLGWETSKDGVGWREIWRNSCLTNDWHIGAKPFVLSRFDRFIRAVYSLQANGSSYITFSLDARMQRGVAEDGK